MSPEGVEEGWLQSHVRGDMGDQVLRLAQRIATEPFRSRSWTELGYFVVSSLLAGMCLFILVVLSGAGVALSVVFIGVLVLAGALRAARGFGRWQRTLARRLLCEELSDPAPFVHRPGFFGWLRATLTDAPAWRAAGYFVAKVPLTIFGVWFGLSIWAAAFFDVMTPLTGGYSARFGFLAHVVGAGQPGPTGPGFATRLGIFVVGLALLALAPWTMRVVVLADRRLMALLLGPGESATRVRSLEESRSKTLDTATETLRRIERDLHDGTQAQLVALAMRLGQAKDKLEHLGSEDQSADIAAVRRLVDEAHRGAKEAITDLRDLARGIHPPALDTGLENALATLAARSPVPTEVSVSIVGRPSPAIESISYFCAAELLANVAQHAHASSASLSCAQHGPWLRIVVRDNGRGGATLTPGGYGSSGLAGLSDRVRTVDGHLSVASPPGGPTVVTIDLPMQS